ncbi:CHAT domain-containing tetratricopeptide repeat protein [Pseudorhodoferax sp.]|uniref:CHAT domain-containing tetratricopeptide repeat protein n=1 Tax=Pseudorhodoferax sp. TaxID=1993553 RepID=UPI002DD6257F|nr:CHAT domain-containing protein [Pseudorhodoferax sp.]
MKHVRRVAVFVHRLLLQPLRLLVPVLLLCAGAGVAQAQALRQGLPLAELEAQSQRLEQDAADVANRHGELSAEHFAALRALTDHHYFHQRSVQWVQAQQKVLALSMRAWGEDDLRVAQALNNLGAAYMTNGDPASALPVQQRALAIRERQLGPDHVDVAFVLTNLGGTYRDLARYAEARAVLERALAIRERQLGPDHLFVSWTLKFLGQTYLEAGDAATALGLHRREQAIRERQVQDTRHGSRERLVAESLSSVAAAQQAMGDVEAAWATRQQQLKLARRSDGEAGPTLRHALDDAGLMALARGDYGRALQLFEQARAMAQQLYGPDNRYLAAQLSSLGLLHLRVGDAGQAATWQQQALAMGRSRLSDVHPQVLLWQRRLAEAWSEQGRHTEARQQLAETCTLLQQARPAARAEQADCARAQGEAAYRAGDLPAAMAALVLAAGWLEADEGAVSTRTATLLAQAQTALAAGDAAAARAHALQALPLALQGRSPDQQARALELLAAAGEALGQRGAGLFWRKQAVNLIQQIRAGASQAPADFQHRFVTRRRDSFVQLADRLAAAGRVAEAQAVVAMLKEDELHQFIQRDVPLDPRTTRVPFAGPGEPEADAAYRRLAARLEAVGARHAAALARVRVGELQAAAPAAAEARQAWDDAQADWQALVERLALSLPDPAAARAGDAGGAGAPHPALQQMLATLGPRSALLHVVVTEHGVLLMLNTAERQQVRRVALPAAELNRQVARLRQAIQQHEPLPAVLPLAQALHRVLVAPVAAELRRSRVQTLLLSLDGSLRYLPFAALHDGRRFLAERHALVLFNPAAAAQVATAPRARWSLTALGATRGNAELGPLPAVQVELERLRNGPLPASVYLDERFTRQRLVAAIEGDDPVLHVASHFSFRPGALADSYLLLGDGGRLTLQELRRGNLSFRGIELLTLSACDTALGGGIDQQGAEVESFAALTQRQGAHAVLATLWPVADAGSAEFMARFYGQRPAGRRSPKALALQQAQRRFLQGRPAAGIDARHPYYWAGYVLMGNPR